MRHEFIYLNITKLYEVKWYKIHHNPISSYLFDYIRVYFLDNTTILIFLYYKITLEIFKIM